MTDNRTTLLPCPFCGGEVEMLTAESMNGGYLFGIMCNDCRSRGDVYDTEAEAIAAWNSRADYHGYEQAAIEAWESIKAWNSRAERTCCIEGGYYDELMNEHYTQLSCDHETSEYEPNYCPKCGARVVGRDDE